MRKIYFARCEMETAHLSGLNAVPFLHQRNGNSIAQSKTGYRYRVRDCVGIRWSGIRSAGLKAIAGWEMWESAWTMRSSIENLALGFEIDQPGLQRLQDRHFYTCQAGNPLQDRRDWLWADTLLRGPYHKQKKKIQRKFIFRKNRGSRFRNAGW